MMGKLAILMDANGRQITNPIAFDAHVSWSARDGVAQEPANPSATSFRAQAWQFKPSYSHNPQ